MIKDNHLLSLDKYKKWKHFTIDNALPGKAWGTGGNCLADIDGDGTLNVIISRREPQTAFWYKRINDLTWVKYIIGSASQLENTLGAAVLDMNGNGLLDVVFSHIWFANPGNLVQKPDTLWQAVEYPGGGHDIVAADININGRLDLVTYDGHTLQWFDTSNNLDQTIIAEGLDQHGGVAPRGVADINGNGLADIVIPGTWYQNPGSEYGDWIPHPWPYMGVSKASYGTSARTWVVDINHNRCNDIVYSDCDTGYGHVYWVENLAEGEAWIRHQLPDPPGNLLTGSFHSLAVADFGNSGYLDIFAGEQEDPDTYMEADGLLPMKPPNLQERGVIWVNDGTQTPRFSPVVIHEGRPGWHDVAIGDIDGDGDIDLVSKVWNADGPNYHLDFWRNDIVDS
jgi:hypothetical protein